MKKITLFSLFCLFLFEPVFAEKSPGQIEALFIWRASEELKLEGAQEKKFSQVIKSLSAQKKALLSQMDSSIQKMKSQKGKELQKSLQSYKESLKKYSQISILEVQKLEEILGEKKLAKYLLLKSELSEKVKKILSEEK